jgi:3-hydroxy acid dehydrogenase/malonic semialdehyde reductase
MIEVRPKTVLVTGASSGIGAAIARQQLERGCRVICLALRRDELEATFAGAGEAAVLLPLDLSATATILPALEALPDELHSVDALVNCAGIDAGGASPFHEVAPETIVATIAVNLTALMLVTRFVLPAMRRNDAGDIVNIGSILGHRAGDNMCAYSATKYGVRGFSEALRHDLRTTKVRVSEVVPGTVKTNFARHRWPDDVERAETFYDRFPMTLSADDVARTVGFILEQPPNVQLGSVTVIANTY